MTARTVTIDRLRELGACKETLGFLSDRFGDTVAITEDNALACAGDIDWQWAADNLLNEDQRGLYAEAPNKHWEAYKNARDRHWEAYKNTLKQQWGAYTDTLEQHRRACAKHWKAYEEACAKAFVTAYYTR